MVKLAQRMSYIGASGIRKMFELAAAMKNPVNLSLGQADFDTPEAVKEGAIAAIREGKNRYSVTAGVPELIDGIRAALEKEDVRPESIMGIAGGSGGLLLALLVLADETAEVLIADPGFVSYAPLIRTVGATPRFIDTYPDFRLTPERLRGAATARSRVLIFNSPVNPTGVAYTREEISALAKVSRELGIQVISDEVYDLFCYDFPHECWLKHDPGAVLVRSFSKTGGVPGWRAGFVAGPKDLVEHMKVMQQFTFVCVNTPAQWGAIESLKMDMSRYVDAYRKRRDFICSELKGAYTFNRPEGAFYLFPEVPDFGAEEFLRRCIERELLIVPGGAFSSRNTHFRISYAADHATLQRGVKILLDIARA